MWVPYTCYYHLYSRDDLYACAERTGVDWILSMGDSQEREFVAQLKNINGSVHDTTKFEQVDFIMHGSHSLRVTWQFYMSSLQWTNLTLHTRHFSTDQQYLDHFNIRPSQVLHCCVSALVLWCFGTSLAADCLTLAVVCHPRVPKFSPYVKRACACAQRPGLPQACGCG